MNNLNYDTKDSIELLQLVSFRIGNEEFGVDILNVQEINRMVDITHIPNSTDYVEGIINLRGRVLPVIDLRKRLGLLKKEYDNDTRIIVVDLEGKTIGFLVDSVNEVLRIPVNVTEAPPEIVVGMNSNYLKAVGKLNDRLIILLDLNKVLLESEIEIISEFTK